MFDLDRIYRNAILREVFREDARTARNPYERAENAWLARRMADRIQAAGGVA